MVYFQRMQTLLVELKQSGKANVFKDQRLGEKNPSLSAEEKAIQRFALERKVSFLGIIVKCYFCDNKWLLYV